MLLFRFFCWQLLCIFNQNTFDCAQACWQSKEYATRRAAPIWPQIRLCGSGDWHDFILFLWHCFCFCFNTCVDSLRDGLEQRLIANTTASMYFKYKYVPYVCVYVCMWVYVCVKRSKAQKRLNCDCLALPGAHRDMFRSHLRIVYGYGRMRYCFC